MGRLSLAWRVGGRHGGAHGVSWGWRVTAGGQHTLGAELAQPPLSAEMQGEGCGPGLGPWLTQVWW